MSEETLQYRKCKTSEMILSQGGAIMGMCCYILISYASYSGNIGYGIATTAIGIIMTASRIFDGITDPLFAFIYDRVSTKHGKIRILMVVGWLIEAAGLFGMFTLFSSKFDGTLGMIIFIAMYIVYILGYTVCQMTSLTIAPVMSNDPKQRPRFSVVSTIYSYLVPMILTVVLNFAMLPKFGGEYNQAFLSAAALVCIAISFIGLIMTLIGVRRFDKPENFEGIGAQKKEKLNLKMMGDVLAHNKPLQCYIVSGVSDKLAQQVSSQTIIATMMNGIIIGNMGISTLISAIAMFPSIIFAFIGSHYAGKHGNQKGVVTWTWVSMFVSIGMTIFLVGSYSADHIQDIAKIGSPMMIIYMLILLVLSGTKMCISAANGGFTADIIDYELFRSGHYEPAVVTGVYSIVDKVVSSFSALIATSCVALIGYSNTLPQPTDALTPAIFWMTMFLLYGLPILGWICTIVAMRFSHLDKDTMVKIQTAIAEQKAADKSEEARQNA